MHVLQKKHVNLKYYLYITYIFTIAYSYIYTHNNKKHRITQIGVQRESITKICKYRRYTKLVKYIISFGNITSHRDIYA